MSDLDLKQQAFAAREFVESAFGQHLLKTFRDSKDSYLNIAMGSAETMEQKALVVEHAAGIAEMIAWIDNLVWLADNPEQLKEEKGDGEEDS